MSFLTRCGRKVYDEIPPSTATQVTPGEIYDQIRTKLLQELKTTTQQMRLKQVYGLKLKRHPVPPPPLIHYSL